jgi:hypothetical protein
MSVFHHIDKDKAIGFMAFYWWHPLRIWHHGIPEEIPFLHDFFRHSVMHPDGADIGVRTPAIARQHVVRLHQQGPKRTDKFGADFAITIDVQGKFTLRKTALFQTKLAKNYSATVVRRQLDEVLTVPENVGRAFIMAVDRDRSVIRVQSAEALASEFKGRQQARKKFDTGNWIPSTDFFTRWLECGIGLPSTTFEPRAIEPLLSSRIADGRIEFPRYESATNFRMSEGAFIPEH